MISMGREDFIELYESLGGSVTGDETTPQAIRVNPIKTEDDELITILTDQGVEIEKIPFLDHGYKVLSSPFLNEVPHVNVGLVGLLHGFEYFGGHGATTKPSQMESGVDNSFGAVPRINAHG